MELSSPVQDPFVAAAEMLRGRSGGKMPYGIPESAPAIEFDRWMARRFRSLTRREFEFMLREFQAGLEKERKLHERFRRPI